MANLEYLVIEIISYIRTTYGTGSELVANRRPSAHEFYPCPEYDRGLPLGVGFSQSFTAGRRFQDFLSFV